MIIIGYQCIGKSSLSRVENGCIDLESSNFFLDGIRDENWYKIYAKIAVNLSKYLLHHIKLLEKNYLTMMKLSS